MFSARVDRITQPKIAKEMECLPARDGIPKSTCCIYAKRNGPAITAARNTHLRPSSLRTA